MHEELKERIHKLLDKCTNTELLNEIKKILIRKEDENLKKSKVDENLFTR